jgi:ABC-2 type transport system ATP-binding protein
VTFGVVDVDVDFGPVRALHRVTLEVPSGSVVAVVGGDGAGKSTLLRCLVGQVAPASGSVSRPARAGIGYMPSTSGTWRELSVDENVDFVAGAFGMRAERLASRRADLLARAGLDHVGGRLAGDLSGGMRHKLGFVLAMLHAPALLVLDEPSTGVDPVSRVELWRLVADAATTGTAVAMTTSYLDEAERATSVLVLDRGEVVASGTREDIVSHVPGRITAPDTPRVRARAWRRRGGFREWVPAADGTDGDHDHDDAADHHADHPGGDHADPRVGHDVDVDFEDAVIARLLARRARSGSAAPAPGDTRRAPAARADGRGPQLAARAVTRRFGTFTAVDRATLDVGSGEIVGLLGANGAGKTTLIRMLLGLLATTDGSVSMFGARPSRRSRRRLGYVPQGLGLYVDMTVEENVEFAVAAFGADRDAVELPVGLGDVRDRLVGEIGLGRQRQLAFACALGHAPEVLVLDEPTSGVDPIARARLWDRIHECAAGGMGVLVTTHYMQEAEQCDRLVLMADGAVVAQGTLDSIIGDRVAVEVTTESWADAFAVLTAADLRVMLAGRTVRVAEARPDAVRELLGTAGLEAHVEVVPATLDEAMVAVGRR